MNEMDIRNDEYRNTLERRKNLTDDICALYEQGWRPWQIANNLGVSESTVRYQLKNSGLI